jgi:predicted DNA-binding transcriptional regulator YafY
MEIDRRVRNGEYPHPDALAIELEVARRVIFNDRAYMVNVLGAPLEYSREKRGWYYTELNWILPTVLVTRGELLAFLLAVEAAQRQLGPALENELTAVIEKIGRGLTDKIAVDLEALRRHFTFASLPAARAEPRTLLALHEAIERQNVVAMEYFSAHRNERTARRVEPHHLHNSGGDWYLLAFDPAKKKMLTFNIARVESLKTLPQTFVRRRDFSADKFLKSGFRAESGPQEYSVTIRFDAAQSPYIRERIWHSTQELEEQPDGGVLLRFKASGLGEIARWILQYGAHAEVLAPPELRALVASQARETARLYAGKGKA